MQYYGTRLSENISRREPEGYLLCLNVPVARTGTQDYLPEELSLPPGSAVIPVFRPPEEVFSPAAMASFEGMPVTDGHPPEGVDVTNIRALQKGHAHNVRRGSGEESDLLLADLIVTDPALITAILEDGKREISCGYTYELREENGRYVQRQIRGNHVAVVDAGRAGVRVSIRDEPPSGSLIRVTDAMLQPPGLQSGMRRLHQPTTERRKHMMKKSLSKVLARMAKDGDTETVAEILEEMMENENSAELNETPGAETAPGDPAAAETPEESAADADGESAAEIIARLDRIIELLTPAAADGDATEEMTEAVAEALEQAALEAEDPMAGEIASVMEELIDPVASVVLEDPEKEEENGLPETVQTADAIRAALASVRPALALMPAKLRRRVAGDIAARLRAGRSRRSNDAGVYAALASAGRKTAPSSADLGRRIMEKRNPNYKK